MPKFPRAFVQLRTCYRHPAGELAVAMAATLEARGWVERVATSRWPLGGYSLTETGTEELINLGLDVEAISPTMVHKACSDYTQRLPDGARGVPHIGGTLGAAMTEWLVSNCDAQRLPHPSGVFEARILSLAPNRLEHLRAIGLVG